MALIVGDGAPSGGGRWWLDAARLGSTTTASPSCRSIPAALDRDVRVRLPCLPSACLEVLWGNPARSDNVLPTDLLEVLAARAVLVPVGIGTRPAVDAQVLARRRDTPSESHVALVPFDAVIENVSRRFGGELM
jgi:hypothetical protein